MPITNYLPSSRLIQPGVCTSSTRPASPYEGMVIYETDTNKTKVYDGSSWITIANATGGGANVRLDYQTRTSLYSITASSAGSASNIFSSNLSFTADGSSTYWVEMYCEFGYTGYSSAQEIFAVMMMDGSGNALSQVYVSPKANVSGERAYSGFFIKTPYTPSAGAKTLNFRAYNQNYAGTAGGLAADTGTGSAPAPMWCAVYGPALS